MVAVAVCARVSNRHDKDAEEETAAVVVVVRNVLASGVQATVPLPRLSCLTNQTLLPARRSSAQSSTHRKL